MYIEVVFKKHKCFNETVFKMYVAFFNTIFVVNELKSSIEKLLCRLFCAAKNRQSLFIKGYYLGIH